MEFQHLQKLIEAVCQVESDWYRNDWNICWFRGGNTEHELIPGQYRKEYRNNIHDEESTFLEFKQQARGFLNKNLFDWEMYFLMQHYRVPTRLLDWTGNCLMALYFALTSQSDGGEPCVWMLNPFLFNEHNAPITDPYILVPPESVDDNHWINFLHPLRYNPKRRDAEDKNGEIRNIERPVAISPPLIDARIIAQSSYFTLHGSCRESLEKITPNSDVIRKFVFTGEPEEMQRQLVCFGITNQRVFPDLEGLGQEFRQRLMRKV